MHILENQLYYVPATATYLSNMSFVKPAAWRFRCKAKLGPLSTLQDFRTLNSIILHSLDVMICIARTVGKLTFDVSDS